MLDYGGKVAEIWQAEKIATLEGICVSKKMALCHYASERQKIMLLTHREALKELIGMRKIDSRVDIIRAVTNNSLMDVS